MPQAQYALGKLLLSDDPDVHDPTEGIRWMKAAAQNGNDYAAYTLGKAYLTGKHAAYAWFQAARLTARGSSNLEKRKFSWTQAE